MFDEAEGDLIESTGGEVLFQAVDGIHGGSIRQSGDGINRIRAFASGGIVLFEGQSPGVDSGVAFGAAGLISMGFEFLSESQRAIIRFGKLRHIRGRIGWWFGDNFAGQPCSAFNGIGFTSVGESGEYSCLCQQSSGIAIVRDGMKSETGFTLICQTVVGCDLIIGDDVICLHEF